MLTISTFNFAQDSKSLLNKLAPDLNFEKIINYEKPGVSSADLKPKILIIDFWATWCAPCIASFPHLEKIQNKYKDKLQIITVTDETEERIKGFLSKRKMSLPVAFDIDGKLAAAFPHRALPHTVVIDGQNIVRAVTVSSAITDEVVDKIIAGQTLALEEKKENLNFDISKPLSGKSNFIYQATITPYQEGYPEGLTVNYAANAANVYANRRILAVNAGLKTLYETAYQFPTGIRTIIEAKDKAAFEWSKKSAYCYELIVPEEIGDQRFLTMRQQLAQMFPYKAIVERRETSVKILRKIKGATLSLKPGSGKSSSALSSQGLTMINTPFSRVSAFLQTAMKITVIDETGITGTYDVEIPYFNEDPNRIYEELKKIGLELVDDKRSMETLVIHDK